VEQSVLRALTAFRIRFWYSGTDMKILFIGGTGNISDACAALFHRQGHEITILSRGQAAVSQQYQQIRTDRYDRSAMQTALQGVAPDVVLNFLGYDLPELQTDYELFQGRVTQYLFISSATVYAKPPPRLPITEDFPLGNPWWDYAQKKLACENWLLERWREEQFPVTIVRPSHTYSERWIPNPISSSSYTFAKRLEEGRPVYVPDKGLTPWTLTASSDFAVGLAGLLGNQQALGEAFHITSDEALTWMEIYTEIAAALGAPDPKIVPVPTDFICQVAPRFIGTLKGDKAHPAVFDNSKLKRFVPGFTCRKPFRIGVRESVAWLRAHPEHQNYNEELDRFVDRVISEWVNSKDSHHG
jgi:nucleoside-diphosphate-sugar epimerase